MHFSFPFLWWFAAFVHKVWEKPLICSDKVHPISNQGIFPRLKADLSTHWFWCPDLGFPPIVSPDPALLLLNRGNRIVYGDEILEIFKPILNKKNSATNKNGEPLAFSNYEMGATLSDNYSYLDQNSDDMATGGEGGMRQMHSFASYNIQDEIETPPETFISPKIKSGNVSKLLSKLQEERSQDINQSHIKH